MPPEVMTISQRPAWASERPLLGVKQTSFSGGWMSAFSQKETVRPEGANHQWRKVPPRKLSVDLVADERGGWPSAVCLAVKPVGEPDAGNRQVRFDERGGETGPRQAGLRRRRESAGHHHRKPTATAPLLDSTLPIFQSDVVVDNIQSASGGFR